MSARIFIVEDHPDIRQSLAGMLTHVTDMQVCGAVGSAEEALAQLEKTTPIPDLVLIDVSLPAMNGLEFLREAKRRWPELRCVMLTGHNESAYADRAFSLGAQGYVAKGDAGRLLDAIQCVLNGDTYGAGARETERAR